MSGNRPAEPNFNHSRKEQGAGSTHAEKTNAQLLDDLERLLDCQEAEDLDVDQLEACLDALQERAPVMEDFDPSSIMARLQAEHPALFESEEKENEEKEAISSPDASPRSVRRSGRARRILRRVEIAAALIVVLCIGASAVGLNPFQAITQWASEVLHIGRNPSGVMELPEGTASEYRSLEEALAAYGVDPSGCPTWVPEDYTLYRIDVQNSSGGLKFVATYATDYSEMYIRVTQFSDGASSVFEKEEGGYIYTHNGLNFEIVDNLEVTKAGWQIGPYIYTITGQIDISEIQDMIDSIELQQGENNKI